MKAKGFKGRKNYTLRYIKAKFGFKPLVERRALVISLKVMEPTKFDSMRKDKGSLGMRVTMGEILLRDLRIKTSRCFS